jgi:glucose/arabinose dehydrogenase
MRRLSTLLVFAGLAVLISASAPRSRAPSCDPDNGGIKLPSGFCATIFADTIRGARELVVAPNGDVFVAVSSVQNQPGGIMALRDADHDGHAEVREKIASGFISTHVGLFGGSLYADARPMGGGRGSPPLPVAILRYRMAAGALTPTGAPDTIVRDLPGLPTHTSRNFAITPQGVMYVNVGSPSNSCQPQDRAPGIPGKDPCTELETRAGIWQFDARKIGQTQAGAVHFARGIRNAVGIAINPADGRLWTTQHGRDQLGDWGNKLGFTNDSAGAVKFNAEVPAEELFQVNRGDDFGWPYCYYDPLQKKKVLAPEYGGDGKQVGRCADKKSNVAFFPGHWAPNALLLYSGSMLPAKYRNGAFIAFHGSWNRAPEPPGGYNVVFQPLANGKVSGRSEIFAEGFPTNLSAANAAARGNHRPTGLAQGPDGALYISDDAGGRIWKVVYTGGK